MALTKVTYTDHQTVIGAANLNAIQDEIINKCVTVEAKTFTAAQKTQARTNIGIGDVSIAYDNNNGVVAYKISDNIVNLIFKPTSAVTASAAGWVTVDTLPSDCRPFQTIHFTCFDNGASSFSDSKTVDTSILGTGEVRVYLYSDKLSVTPRGSVVFFSH